ncbi:MAG: hypothetical protein ACO1SV_22425 [Fimbriimonas sp.]
MWDLFDLALVLAFANTAKSQNAEAKSTENEGQKKELEAKCAVAAIELLLAQNYAKDQLDLYKSVTTRFNVVLALNAGIFTAASTLAKDIITRADATPLPAAITVCIALASTGLIIIRNRSVTWNTVQISRKAGDETLAVVLRNPLHARYLVDRQTAQKYRNAADKNQKILASRYSALNTATFLTCIAALVLAQAVTEYLSPVESTPWYFRYLAIM